MDFLGCLRQQAELRGRMLINASGHDKIFVRANGFQINQLHTIVDGVTQQIELPLAVKFVDKQISQVTFFSFADGRLSGDQLDRIIDINRNVVIHLFVLTGKSPRLDAMAISIRIYFFDVVDMHPPRHLV